MREISEERPSSFFSAWGQKVLAYRSLFLILSSVSVLLSGWLIATKTTVNMSVEAFTDQGSRVNDTLREFRQDFGRDDLWVIAAKGAVFTTPYLEALQRLHGELEGFKLTLSTERGGGPVPEEGEPEGEAISEGEFGDDFEGDFEGIDADDGWGDEEGGGFFEELRSLVDAEEARAAGEGIEVSRLFIHPPKDLPTLASLKARALGEPAIVDQLVNRVGTVSLITLRAPQMNDSDGDRVTEALRDLMAKHRRSDFQLSLAGIPTLNTDMKVLTLGNMQRLFGGAMILMIALLFWLFRHPLVVVSPLLVVVLAALNTFGFMAGVGIPITMLSMILPAFIICVGLGDSVHLISVFRSMLGRGLSRHEALVFAIGSTGKPIVYTSLTTMIGLLSFRFASIEGIQQMGTAGAIGVCAACLHSLLLLPILLSFLGEGAQLGGHSNQAPDRLSHFLRWCNLCSTSEGDDGRGALPFESRRRRRLTLFFGALLFGALLASMSLLEVYHNPLSWLSEEQPLRRSFALMDEEMGGSADIHLLIEGGEEKGLRDLSLFQGLEALETHIKTFKHPRYGAIVGPVVSPLNVVKSTVRALNEGDEEAYRLPKDDASLSESLFLFENAGPDEMKRMMTTDLSRGRASLRLRWLDASAYAPVAAHLEAGIRAHIPAQVKVRPTGTVYSLLSTIGQLIIDLGKSFGVACFIITVLLIMQLRSVKLGLIAMVPNLTPIIFVMGFMAITGIPIDMVNILIASLAIGIAVDDTIHMLHHFQIHFREHANVEEAIHNAFEHAGRAMVSTSVVLGSGFAAFSFATISNIQRFGLLITLTAVAAMLIDLIFTPALLRLCFAREEARQAVSKAEKSEAHQGET